MAPSASSTGSKRGRSTSEPLAAASRGPAGRSPTSAKTPRKRLRRGSKITSFLTVLARLNKKSSDAVFLVWNHTDWCPMACKVFGSARRAKREALALTSLSHPNIIRCLGYQEPHFTLMEFLEGPILSSLIHKAPDRRLDVSDALRVAIHVGAALAHIHSKGFLHMDVKPDNIILVNERPVLFDFGSMRVIGAERPPHVDGTDPYIAPEEALKLPVNEAADVFSFGAMLHEMLTGRYPFPDVKRNAQLPQVTQPPAPLSSVLPGVDAGLEAIVLNCLKHDPKMRPSLDKLLPALHRLIKQGPPMWPDDLRPGRGLRRGGRKRANAEASGVPPASAI